MAKDISGQRFGRLTVLGLSEISRNGHKRYSVVCDCGVQKTVFATHLLKGATQSCGCLKRESRNFQGCGGVSLTYFHSLKRGAEGGKGRKALPFEVTIEYLAELLDRQGNRCALTGMPISYRDKTASVDRMDSSSGYIEGNLQWVHKDVNMMKRHYSLGYFAFLCKKVCDNADRSL